MIHQFRHLATLALSVFVTLPALATVPVSFSDFADMPAHYDCTQTIGGKKFELVSNEANGAFDVKLAVDGKDVPVLGKGCFQSNRPGTRYLLCAFNVGKTRVDVYPWVETVSGMIKPMQYIVWNGENSTAQGRFNSCKN